MLGLLVKKQLYEIFRSYFYDAKKNKARSKLATAFLCIFFLVLMVGLLGSMFYGMATTLGDVLLPLSLEWMYFAMIGVIAVALGVFGSVFNTYSSMYIAKDNDILLSMPIPVHYIMLARILGVYIMGFMYAAVVAIPGIIVYFSRGYFSVASCIGCILWLLHITIINLILSCLLGWVVAKLSKKVKSKSFVVVVLSLCFIILYYTVIFRVQELLQEFMLHALLYGEFIKNKIYPIYMMGQVGTGSIVAILIVTLILAILLVATWCIMEHSYLDTMIATGIGKTSKYQKTSMTQKKQKNALFQKEWRRFIASSNYMLNCGLGILFIPIMGILLIVKRKDLFLLLQQLEMDSGIIFVMMLVVVCVGVSMNDMVTPSVSLEGNTIWILQSLPIAPKSVLLSKCKLQIALTLPVVLFLDVCIMIAFGPVLNLIKCILLVMYSVLFVVCDTVIGMTLGLAKPNLKWTSEISVIKQSITVLLTILIGWIHGVAVIFIYINGGSTIGAVWYSVIVIALDTVITVVLGLWILKKGTKIFAKLS